jgi:hypothetical protein
MNTVATNSYSIRFPNGNFYNDEGTDSWPFRTACAIASNISKKRKVVTYLVKNNDEVETAPAAKESPVSTTADSTTADSTTADSTTTDRAYEYVNSLKGKALTESLVAHGLPKGSDPVASKRERLAAHLIKTWRY